MTIENHQSLILPSNPEDRERIKRGLKDVVDGMIRIHAEQVKNRETLKWLSEEFEIPKKIVSNAAKVIFKDNYNTVIAENDDFDTFLRSLGFIKDDE